MNFSRCSATTVTKWRSPLAIITYNTYFWTSFANVLNIHLSFGHFIADQSKQQRRHLILPISSLELLTSSVGFFLGISENLLFIKFDGRLSLITFYNNVILAVDLTSGTFRTIPCSGLDIWSISYNFLHTTTLISFHSISSMYLKGVFSNLTLSCLYAKFHWLTSRVQLSFQPLSVKNVGIRKSVKSFSHFLTTFSKRCLSETLTSVLAERVH